MTHSNKTFSGVPLSILDLSPLNDQETPRDALQHSVELAQHAEDWGYYRYWVAEHHNAASSASVSPPLLINQIANHTETIRLGSGGMMLPNHSPLVVAEQFGLLSALHPDRIDLGLGRAPGTDQLTARALRRGDVHAFPEHVREIQHYFNGSPKQQVRAVTAEQQQVPIFLLGSSTFSAKLAAEMGLAYAFAGHFSPGEAFEALTFYREHFKPSDALEEPYAILALNVIAGETDEDARFLFSSMEQLFLNMIRSKSLPIQPPRDLTDEMLPHEQAAVKRSLDGSIIGSLSTVKAELVSRIETLPVDEVMATSLLYNQTDRLNSYQRLSTLLS
jgi:luciferase family oxidoreductase group 1